MKFAKIASVAVLSAILTACGGSGYEGTYTISLKGGNEMMKKMAQMAIGSGQLIIGDNYIESNGQRTEFEDILVRKSGDASYLVFKSKGGEEALQIIDKDTLEKKTPAFTLQYKKS